MHRPLSRQRELNSKPQELPWNGIVISQGAPVPTCLIAIVMNPYPSLAHGALFSCSFQLLKSVNITSLDLAASGSAGEVR
ncbi:hypothetical protein AV530_002625 [Patagioenas fasciata monilis]|uniref:Uncharacterized protein n=1 Tax=Patagioenas fasciata monilis TaxID=372326 RepID=A0A1V4K7D4_PATFA|nr:hypothetical protein AV530_002625 [Patagioenas fasciata monilis]